MDFKYVGNKADKAQVTIQSDEASIVIMSGAPIALKANGSYPGLSVTSIEGLAAANTPFFAGFNIGPAMNPTDYAKAQVYGFFEYARVLLSTRATSTDVWASYSAIAIGDIMSLVTTSGVQAVQRSGAGSASNQGWWLNAGATLVSATTQASSIANGVGNSTAMVTQLRCFVRALGA